MLECFSYREYILLTFQKHIQYGENQALGKLSYHPGIIIQQRQDVNTGPSLEPEPSRHTASFEKDHKGRD